MNLAFFKLSSLPLRTIAASIMLCLLASLSYNSLQAADQTIELINDNALTVPDSSVWVLVTGKAMTFVGDTPANVDLNNPAKASLLIYVDSSIPATTPTQTSFAVKGTIASNGLSSLVDGSSKLLAPLPIQFTNVSSNIKTQTFYNIKAISDNSSGGTDYVLFTLGAGYNGTDPKEMATGNSNLQFESGVLPKDGDAFQIGTYAQRLDKFAKAGNITSELTTQSMGVYYFKMSAMTSGVIFISQDLPGAENVGSGRLAYISASPNFTPGSTSDLTHYNASAATKGTNSLFFNAPFQTVEFSIASNTTYADLTAIDYFSIPMELSKVNDNVSTSTLTPDNIGNVALPDSTVKTYYYSLETLQNRLYTSGARKTEDSTGNFIRYVGPQDYWESKEKAGSYIAPGAFTSYKDYLDTLTSTTFKLSRLSGYNLSSTTVFNIQEDDYFGQYSDLLCNVSKNGDDYSIVVKANEGATAPLCSFYNFPAGVSLTPLSTPLRAIKDDVTQLTINLPKGKIDSRIYGAPLDMGKDKVFTLTPEPSLSDSLYNSIPLTGTITSTNPGQKTNTITVAGGDFSTFLPGFHIQITSGSNKFAYDYTNSTFEKTLLTAKVTGVSGSIFTLDTFLPTGSLGGAETFKILFNVNSTGSITGVTSNKIFASNLKNPPQDVPAGGGFQIRFTSGANSNISTDPVTHQTILPVYDVSGYDAASGTFTLAADLPNAPQAGDEFRILYNWVANGTTTDALPDTTPDSTVDTRGFVLTQYYSNCIYSRIVQDVLMAINFGYPGAPNTSTESAVWFNTFPYIYPLKSLWPNTANYNTWQNAIYDASDAYGFAFSDSLPDSPLLTIDLQNGTNKTLRIRTLPKEQLDAPTPELVSTEASADGKTRKAYVKWKPISSSSGSTINYDITCTPQPANWATPTIQQDENSCIATLTGLAPYTPYIISVQAKASNTMRSYSVPLYINSGGDITSMEPVTPCEYGNFNLNSTVYAPISVSCTVKWPAVTALTSTLPTGYSVYINGSKMTTSDQVAFTLNGATSPLKITVAPPYIPPANTPPIATGDSIDTTPTTPPSPLVATTNNFVLEVKDSNNKVVYKTLFSFDANYIGTTYTLSPKLQTTLPDKTVVYYYRPTTQYLYYTVTKKGYNNTGGSINTASVSGGMRLQFGGNANTYTYDTNKTVANCCQITIPYDAGTGKPVTGAAITSSLSLALSLNPVIPKIPAADSDFKNTDVSFTKKDGATPGSVISTATILIAPKKSYTIIWGDGSTKLIPNDIKPGTMFKHEYTKAGNYTIKVLNSDQQEVPITGATSIVVTGNTSHYAQMMNLGDIKDIAGAINRTITAGKRQPSLSFSAHYTGSITPGTENFSNKKPYIAFSTDASAMSATSSTQTDLSGFDMAKVNLVTGDTVMAYGSSTAGTNHFYIKDKTTNPTIVFGDDDSGTHDVYAISTIGNTTNGRITLSISSVKDVKSTAHGDPWEDLMDALDSAGGNMKLYFRAGWGNGTTFTYSDFYLDYNTADAGVNPHRVSVVTPVTVSAPNFPGGKTQFSELTKDEKAVLDLNITTTKIADFDDPNIYLVISDPDIVGSFIASINEDFMKVVQIGSDATGTQQYQSGETLIEVNGADVASLFNFACELFFSDKGVAIVKSGATASDHILSSPLLITITAPAGMQPYHYSHSATSSTHGKTLDHCTDASEVASKISTSTYGCWYYDSTTGTYNIYSKMFGMVSMGPGSASDTGSSSSCELSRNGSFYGLLPLIVVLTLLWLIQRRKARKNG